MSARTRIDALRPRRPYPFTRYASEEAELFAQVVKGKGILESLIVTNNSETAAVVMIFDADGQPANGETPLVRFGLPANGDYPATVAFDTDIAVEHGAVAILSTTLGTLTASEETAFFYAEASDEKK
jgi:hypothetical protein